MVKKDEKVFIKDVSVLHGDRLHVEIPKKERKNFKQGDYVKVKKIKT